jgi:hypothetical protein
MSQLFGYCTAYEQKFTDSRRSTGSIIIIDMSVQRSPPSYQAPLSTTPAPHYNSDSALNTSRTGIVEENNYFNVTKRQKRQLEDTADQSVSSLSDITTLFNCKFDHLNNTLLAIMAQNQSIQTTVQNISLKQEELLTKVNELELENTIFKKRVAVLEKTIDTLEKKCISTSLEIRNLPKQKDESKETLIAIVKEMTSTLGITKPIEETEIREIYRTKPETIIVDFTTSLRKEHIIRHYKSFNKRKRDSKETTLNSGDLHLPGSPQAIFVSEYLTSKARRLFFLARESVKDKKLAATWTSFGKIYIKKHEDTPPVRINNEEELHRVAQ